ncbi:Sec-independent protein translocase protein TatB [Thiothrix subterranea]|uniref:Sec-independent protein translocase protein TatB n=1 Tax=Thiothrix subterranea TaxID=2735563 RepID=A0AA51QXK1_9GAMM|nr:Sec-independent protein translocase protein TatB [Thiothrix subterranea]MDQ5769183.1 Sec-independent protein translocase protein TatB [Thiothrix subterranea]QQZ29324.1 twin-arginine translocase subunit TatB [Thiothrix subterranea]WML87338.1 Sec-independent protein translocase protein TatB [Thiothrix subterranea]
MFESSFLEMLVVGVIALLVIGPERLPGLARKAGRLLGKARAFIATTRTDIERELRTEEMRGMLSRQEEEIRELRNLMQQNTQDVRHSIEDATKPHDEKS